MNGDMRELRLIGNLTRSVDDSDHWVPIRESLSEQGLGVLLPATHLPCIASCYNLLYCNLCVRTLGAAAAMTGASALIEA